MTLYCAGSINRQSAGEGPAEMVLYCAGNIAVVGGPQDVALHPLGLRHRLLSYAEIADIPGTFAFWLDPALADKRVFLDSGAFGAHTRGARINLEAYAAFVKAHLPQLAAVASLDVIGDAAASAANWRRLRELGVDAMPTFHRGSPWPALNDILAERPAYLALGGIASEGPTRADLEPWLDGCWRRLEASWPVQVHAFGLTAQWALEKYPFRSADSSAALVGAGFGRCLSFEDGRIVSRDWVAQGRARADGAVMDGVGAERSAYPRRRLENVRAFRAYERYLTDSWARRGVAWNG